MKHTWTYANIGGSTRVIIRSGKDIQYLAELDEKLWTVLACPVSGLEIPDESLALIDNNHDAKIHIADVIATAQWLCNTLQNPDVLLKGNDTLPLEAIKDEAILAVATPLAEGGVVSLAAVKAAIAGVSIEAQAAQKHLTQPM